MINEQTKNSLLSHHNLIKSKYSILDSINKPENPQINKQTPLFLTNISFRNHQCLHHKSFSMTFLHDANNEIHKKDKQDEFKTSNLTSFHHQIQFQRSRNPSLYNCFENMQNIPKKTKPSIPIINIKDIENYKRKSFSNKQIFSKLDTKLEKRGSLDDVCEILSPSNKAKNNNNWSSFKIKKPMNNNNINILHDFLDPKLNLRKFSIKKANNTLIELTKGRKTLKIMPINNEIPSLELPLSTLRNPLPGFLQKSLKGSANANERENLAIFQQELWEDVEEIKNKINAKIKEKPKNYSNFQVSEKTNFDHAKQEKIKNLFDKYKNPIDLTNYLEIGDTKITYEELRLIKDEYWQKSVDSRDYNLLEMLVRNLKFFEKISKFFRNIILRNSELRQFESKSIIINSDNLGKFMYLILKGGVNIRGKYLDFHHHVNDLVLSSLYDGSYFGDFSLETGWNLSKKPKKGLLSITDPYVEACEESFLLEIPFEKELQEKMKIIYDIGLFKEEENINLFSLASQSILKSYKLGEVVLQAGDIVDKFGVVVSGRCAVLLREEKNQKNVDDYDDKPRQFQKEYKHEVIRVLLENDTFGEKSLLTNEDLAQKTIKFNIDCTDRHAKLEIIADKEETTILELEGKGFSMLPIELQTRMRMNLIEIQEIDQIDIMDLRQGIKNWEKMKEFIGKSLLNTKKNKNKLL